MVTFLMTSVIQDTPYQQVIDQFSVDTAYIRRKIVIWGDCVKLRYGEKPSDSPW